MQEELLLLSVKTFRRATENFTVSTIHGCVHTVRTLFHFFEVEVWTADGVITATRIRFLTSGNFMAKIRKLHPTLDKRLDTQNF